MSITCGVKKALMICSDLSRYKEYEDKLFKIFKSLYESGNLTYNGIEIRMKHRPPSYDERSGFYHLICENYRDSNNEKDREPNLRRCERIKWASAILVDCVNIDPDSLMIWENKRKNHKNILIFCPNVDFLVVLGVRNGYYLLVSAYPVYKRHTKDHLIEEYTKFQDKTSNASI